MTGTNGGDEGRAAADGKMVGSLGIKEAIEPTKAAAGVLSSSRRPTISPYLSPFSIRISSRVDLPRRESPLPDETTVLGVDRSIQILNQLAVNVSKAEALSAEIAGILKPRTTTTASPESPQVRASANPEQAVTKTAPADSLQDVLPSSESMKGPVCGLTHKAEVDTAKKNKVIHSK